MTRKGIYLNSLDEKVIYPRAKIFKNKIKILILYHY